MKRGFDLSRQAISQHLEVLESVGLPDAPNGTKLLLEPGKHPAVKPFKEALVQDGIPFTSFAVGDVPREHARLRAAGVHFAQPPMKMGPVTTAVFDDTCGNLIQIVSKQ